MSKNIKAALRIARAPGGATMFGNTLNNVNGLFGPASGSMFDPGIFRPDAHQSAPSVSGAPAPVIAGARPATVVAGARPATVVAGARPTGFPVIAPPTNYFIPPARPTPPVSGDNEANGGYGTGRENESGDNSWQPEGNGGGTPEQARVLAGNTGEEGSGARYYPPPGETPGWAKVVGSGLLGLIGGGPVGAFVSGAKQIAANKTAEEAAARAKVTSDADWAKAQENAKIRDTSLFSWSETNAGDRSKEDRAVNENAGVFNPTSSIGGGGVDGHNVGFAGEDVAYEDRWARDTGASGAGAGAGTGADDAAGGGSGGNGGGAGDPDLDQGGGGGAGGSPEPSVTESATGGRITRADGGQAITSAATSRHQVPALFRSSFLKKGTTNLDYGGGKYDKGTEFLKARGVESHVFDPFNRSVDHNEAVINRFKKKPADSATLANVLNVIREPHVRKLVIEHASKHVKPDGTLHFGIYEGDGTGTGKATKDGWQNNAKAETYLDEVRALHPAAYRAGNTIIAPKRGARASGGKVAHGPQGIAGTHIKPKVHGTPVFTGKTYGK